MLNANNSNYIAYDTTYFLHKTFNRIILKFDYRNISDIRHSLIGNKIVDHSDAVGASPVGAAPTTSLLLT